MNELRLNGTQEFMGINIPIIEGGFGNDKRIVTAKTISEIHRVEPKVINQSIKRLIGKERLSINIDYIDLLSSEELKVTASDLGLITSNGQKTVFILSERGYSKLIKYMDDDKSWDIMDKFVDSYFAMRQQINTMLSAEDEYALKIFHAQSKEEVLSIMQNYQSNIVKPLRESVDRYERFLCEKTGMLTKSELATKLDCKPQTLASKLKQAKVYTPTLQISSDFLKKYPNDKLIIECDNTYKDKSGNEHTKHGFQWTFVGAKTVVDYLVQLNMVTFTDNNGFKLK